MEEGDLMDWLLVSMGGVTGSLLRFQVGKWSTRRIKHNFPFSTLVINVTGSFILGWLTHYLGILFPAHEHSLSLLLGTGFCGAYTTFSTFSYETISLLLRQRVGVAFLYVAASLVLGLSAAWLGLFGFSI